MSYVFYAKSVVKTTAEYISSVQDDGFPVSCAVVYAGGPEDLKSLFITQGYGVVAVIGEPRVSSARVLQSKNYYDEYVVPVKLIAINKYSGGSIILSASRCIGVALNSFISFIRYYKDGSDYEMMYLNGNGRTVRMAGMDACEYDLNVQVKVIYSD